MAFNLRLCVLVLCLILNTGLDLVTSSPTGLAVAKRSMECVDRSQGCLGIIATLDLNSGMGKLCQGLTGMVQCLDELIEDCGYTLDNLDEVLAQANTARQQVNSVCTGVSSTDTASVPNVDQSAMQCAGSLRHCSGILSGIDFSSDFESICDEAEIGVSCVNAAMAECSSNVPPSMVQDMNKSLKPLKDICGIPNGNQEFLGKR